MARRQVREGAGRASQLPCRGGEGKEAEGLPKILVASSLGAHKGYCLPFLWEVMASLAGAGGYYVALDGLSLPEDHAAPEDVVFETLAPPARGQNGFYRFARVREAARQVFLQGDGDYLFYLDADVIPPVDVLPRLLRHLEGGAQLATGLYCARGLSDPVIYVVTAVGNMPAIEGTGGAMLAEQLGGRTPLDGYVAGERTPVGDVMAIQAGGMGCMLISRAALEAVAFRDAAYFERPDCNGEDIQFCFDVRERFGVLTVLDLGCLCWHVHEDGQAYRVRMGEARYGCFYDDAGTGYMTRGHKWPHRQWHKGVPRFPGPQEDGTPILTMEEIGDLGPSFYKGMCRRLCMETQPWQEAMQQRS